MNKERSAEIEFLRGELVGPARPMDTLKEITLVNLDEQGCFRVSGSASGSLYYRLNEGAALQEIVHHRGETPVQRYGIGLLHPCNDLSGAVGNDQSGGQADAGSGSVEFVENDAVDETIQAVVSDPDEKSVESISGLGVTDVEDAGAEVEDDDFEVGDSDMYQPSVMGISFCMCEGDGEFAISLPPSRKFFWQPEEADPFPVNGRYEPCNKIAEHEGKEVRTEAWKRLPATTAGTSERFVLSELTPGQLVTRKLNLSGGLDLQIQVFPRRMNGRWIITCVLRNQLDARTMKKQSDKTRSILFQTCLEIRVANGGAFSRYPESVRPFEQLDEDEQTLSLLYRDEITWATGHGCSAGWECPPGSAPGVLFTDVMPAVELPSMTPDIRDQSGLPVSLSMRELACLSSVSYNGSGWAALDRLVEEYEAWINKRREETMGLPSHFKKVATRHLDSCDLCLLRIRRGVALLKDDETALDAFRLANQAMLLQQIAAKQIVRRPLIRLDTYVAAAEVAEGKPRTPWNVWHNKSEKKNVGNWRAFQAAFLLMSLAGLVDGHSDERETVDLIWFPTGGGKTEAYLAVAAFYMFHQRLIARPDDELARDGTNVFMRYTLRMLTTQQFQRAASLICSMEQIRLRRKEEFGLPDLGETPYTLGLWIGASGSPNTWKDAVTVIRKFEVGDVSGNPLVLTECPWCRSAIGRLEPTRAEKSKKNKGVSNLAGLEFRGKPPRPYLKCSDPHCEYGGEHACLPVEVIDEAIYRYPPSMFIGTADKFAMMAWKPEAGALFGLRRDDEGRVFRASQPPGLIIQDEFHLISGPLGTIYGLYEGVIEELCTSGSDRHTVRPKIIASTATIRGATGQAHTIYAREDLQLFPSPGLEIGDSFFGRYARTSDDRLAEGRLYLGIHANGYRSFLTAQVRTFSAALFRASVFEDDRKDAWWTLLAFYNSLRELGGAQTLFQSDIAARMKDYAFRYGLKGNDQRYLNKIEELTSRQSQAHLVEIMDRLALDWENNSSIDACLASNIIEVGVDIDRLALMAVVGQPKSTAQYIQVTGRVGRRWEDRPGLILTMFNPGKSRDRSHFEQFHSYHRRLYERVEPTSATPFSVEAVERALSSVLLLWARQCHEASSPGESFGYYADHLDEGLQLLIDRCEAIMAKQPEESARVIEAMRRVRAELRWKWSQNPQEWGGRQQKAEGDYLMLWPGTFATSAQKRKGVLALSSMRSVDGTARVSISNDYLEKEEVDYGQ
tara:strand:+ start:22747 stop:26472 length:3726 start_codon:yes stop_codon:yes gene_type:complete